MPGYTRHHADLIIFLVMILLIGTDLVDPDILGVVVAVEEVIQDRPNEQREAVDMNGVEWGRYAPCAGECFVGRSLFYVESVQFVSGMSLTA